MTDSNTKISKRAKKIYNCISIALGIVLVIFSIPLIIGGVYLLSLGGSLFYLVMGLTLVACGVGFIRKKKFAVWLFLAFAVVNILWALFEVGLQFWPMVPRLSVTLVLLVPVFLLAPGLGFARLRYGAWAGAAVMVVVLAVAFVNLFVPHGIYYDPSARSTETASPTTSGDATSTAWTAYGHGPNATRYVPVGQITKDNVSSLKVAWTFHTGEVAGAGSEDQETPLQVGDTLYACTPLDKVIAIDAETGKQRWVFDPQVKNLKAWNRCRGVSYYKMPAASATTNPATTDAAATATPAAAGVCEERIVLATLDSRLIEIDAKTGQPCANFGQNGTVSLNVGMSDIKPLMYMETSPASVAGDVVIVGGWVYDNLEVGEPSGVIRAFNAKTGDLAWAWDMANPAVTKLPPTGQSYTPGTPNMWSMAAYDPKLELVYVPLGNATPDMWGGFRTPAMDRYSSSIVALDVHTGLVRWAYQTVHHDLWDYDVAPQPALYDMPDGKGGTVPTLIQTTKTGNIFMLDRRDGKPLTQVEERPVPQQQLAGDQTSPTQPFSVGMPYIGKRRLDESDMWGGTVFDQLLCRIEYKSMHYDGPFTPLNTEKTLFNPGNFGGMNWGGVSINEETGMMIVNDIRIPLVAQLLPASKNPIPRTVQAHGEYAPMRGTPFNLLNYAFMSPLQVPCQAPPFGSITGIDLNTKKMVWQIPAGTIQDVSLAGIKATLPIPLGMPTLGSAVATKSGLSFFSATQDYYLRALDQDTGQVVWKDRLPVGTQATPITYISPESGRQFVVVSAGGSRESPDRGDYIIAYALPGKN